MAMRRVKVMAGGAVGKVIHNYLLPLIEKMPDIPGRELLRRWGVPLPMRKMLLFWEVSMSAWVIDTALLALMLECDVPVFVAACLSPLPALLWSFTLSTYKIYFRAGGFSVHKFGFYVAYNGVTTVAFAWLIAHAVKMGFAPMAAKVSVSPLVFLTNFFFMRRLLVGKAR